MAHRRHTSPHGRCKEGPSGQGGLRRRLCSAGNRRELGSVRRRQLSLSGVCNGRCPLSRKAARTLAGLTPGLGLTECAVEIGFGESDAEITVAPLRNPASHRACLLQLADLLQQTCIGNRANDEDIGNTEPARALQCSGEPVSFSNIKLLWAETDRAVQSGDIVIAK